MVRKKIPYLDFELSLCGVVSSFVFAYEKGDDLLRIRKWLISAFVFRQFLVSESEIEHSG